MMLAPELVESIYEAALDHAAVGRMLTQVSAAIPSTQAIVTQIESGRQCPIGIAGIAGAFEDSTVRTYMEHYQDNIWSEAVHAGQGAAVILDEPVPLQALRKTGLYADVLRPTELAHGIGFAAPLGEDRWLRFGLGRDRAGGIYTPQEAAALNTFAAHLRRAIALAERFDAAARIRRAELELLDRVATATLLVDRRGRLVLANQAARRLAASGALRLRDGVAPGIGDRTPAAAFHAAAVAAGAGHVPPAMRFQDASGAPMILIAAPLGGDTALRLAQAGASRRPAAMLLIHAAGDAGPSPDLLRDLFDLTPAEARVAATLAAGGSEQEAAIRLGIGLSSLKTHRKSIFGKIGIARRGELIRLCAALPR